MCPPQEQTPREANVCVLADKNTQQQLGPMFEGLPSTLHSSTWRYTVTSTLVSQGRRLRVGLCLWMQVFVTNDMLITTSKMDFHKMRFWTGLAVGLLFVISSKDLPIISPYTVLSFCSVFKHVDLQNTYFVLQNSEQATPSAYISLYILLYYYKFVYSRSTWYENYCENVRNFCRCHISPHPFVSTLCVPAAHLPSVHLSCGD